VKYLDKLIAHALNNENEWGGSLTITVNEQKLYYEKAVHPIHIQYYPVTPIGFYDAESNDIELAARNILDQLED
jgi:hypothetical protein